MDTIVFLRLVVGRPLWIVALLAWLAIYILRSKRKGRPYECVMCLLFVMLLTKQSFEFINLMRHGARSSLVATPSVWTQIYSFVILLTAFVAVIGPVYFFIIELRKSNGHSKGAC